MRRVRTPGGSRPLRRAGAVCVLALVAVSGGACGGSGATPAGPTERPQATEAGQRTDPAFTFGPPTGLPGTVTLPPGGGVGDPCALLTDADVSSVIPGARIESSDPAPDGGLYPFPEGCAWTLSDASSMVPPQVIVGVMATGGRAYYDTYFAPFNAENGFTAIEGLGDDAVDAGASTVMVVAGDTFFSTQYLGGFGDDDHEVELARKVLANLSS